MARTAAGRELARELLTVADDLIASLSSRLS
jgi:hypothetical protein